MKSDIMNSSRRRLTGYACSALALGLTGQKLAWAQKNEDYPNKSVKVIVSFTAGGTTDVIARSVSQLLAEQFKQPFVIENKPGAGGIGAGEQVARADADGHTLLLMSNATAISATMFTKMPFDALKEKVVTALFVVHAGRGAEVDAELAPAHERPGRTTVTLIPRRAPG